MKKFTILLACIMLFCLFQSCRKNKTIDLNPNVNVSNDVILSVSSYTTVFNLLIKARLDPFLASHGYTKIDSAYITYDSSLMEYVFNFNSAVSPDSVQRTGRIKVRVSGDILSKGSCARVFFENYSEDYGPVGGTDSIYNQGENAFGQLIFSDNISQGIINKAVDGGVVNVNLKCKYITSASSLFSGNDVRFLLQGSLSGISSKGYTFSASVCDTLQDPLSCPWIKEGIIDVHVPVAEIPDGYIDFIASDGCSDVIWYYFGNSSFRLKKNKFFLKN
jgi:hypothetical protein